MLSLGDGASSVEFLALAVVPVELAMRWALIGDPIGDPTGGPIGGAIGIDIGIAAGAAWLPGLNAACQNERGKFAGGVDGTITDPECDVTGCAWSIRMARRSRSQASAVDRYAALASCQLVASLM